MEKSKSGPYADHKTSLYRRPATYTRIPRRKELALDPTDSQPGRQPLLPVLDLQVPAPDSFNRVLRMKAQGANKTNDSY